MPQTDTAKTIIKKLIFNLLMIAAFFVLIEMGARCYHFIKYKDPTIFLYGRKYFAGLVENVRRSASGTVKKSNIDEPAAVDKIFETRKERNEPLLPQEPQKVPMLEHLSYVNKFGFRNEEIDLKKTPGTVRIMMLGDSFVMSTGLDDKTTWECLLNDSLKKLPQRYEIINAGGGGTTIDQQLVNLIDKITKFHPDYVVLFSSQKNTMILDYKTEYSIGWKISTFFYNISQCYAMVREKSALRTFKDNNYYIYDYRIKITKPRIDKLMELYRKRLEQFYAVCKENNIGLIIGLRPEFIPSGLKELQQPLDKTRLAVLGTKLEKQGYLTYYEFEYYTQGLFNLEMKSLAEKNGLFVFDGTIVFPQDKYPYFIDQMHLNQKGASLFADAMYSFIVKNKISKVQPLPNDAI